MSSDEFTITNKKEYNIKLRSIFIGLIAFAIFVNCVMFLFVEINTRHNYRIFSLYETNNIFDIAISRDNSARRWVAPFYYLGVIFPSADIIIPNGGIKSWFPFEEGMKTFGRVNDIVHKDYNPQEIAQHIDYKSYALDLNRYVPDRGSARPILHERLTIAVGQTPSHTFLVATPDGHPGRYKKMVLIDVNLLDPELRKHLNM